MGLWDWLAELSTHVPGPMLAIIIFLGAFMSAGGSFFVLLRQGRISEGIRKQVEENLRQTAENLAQTQEATNRIQEALGYMTGGDSYCYFVPLLTGPAKETLSVGIAVRAPGER
jgi:hypothetical protein